MVHSRSIPRLRHRNLHYMAARTDGIVRSGVDAVSLWMIVAIASIMLNVLLAAIALDLMKEEVPEYVDEYLRAHRLRMRK